MLEENKQKLKEYQNTKKKKTLFLFHVYTIKDE